MIERFSQKESLTTRICGLLQEYPVGTGILKEILQNSDDAGSRVKVRFMGEFFKISLNPQNVPIYNSQPKRYSCWIPPPPQPPNFLTKAWHVIKARRCFFTTTPCFD